jgi:hypothetical protein
VPAVIAQDRHDHLLLTPLSVTAVHETEIFEKVAEEERRMTLAERFWMAVGHINANKIALLGTAGAWFILDVLFYGA